MKKETIRNIALTAGAVSAAGALLVSKTSQEPRTDRSQLRKEAAKIVERDTGCYEFAHAPLRAKTTIDKNGNKNVTIGIPIKDTSVHNPGEDSWKNNTTKDSAEFLMSGFVSKFKVVGGKELQTPFFGEAHQQEGANLQSTDFQVNFYVPKAGEMPVSMTGHNIADVYYVADVSMESPNSTADSDEYRSLRGMRLCGTISYDLQANGEVTGVTALPPSSEVGKLTIMNKQTQEGYIPG